MPLDQPAVVAAPKHRQDVANIAKREVQGEMKRFCRSGLLMAAGCLALASSVSVLAPATLAAASVKENEKATNRLFQAVYADDLTSAQASVAEGANIDARDRWGMTATDIAIDRSHFRIAHFLVSVRNGRRAQAAQADPAAKSAQPAAVPASNPAKNPAKQPAGSSAKAAPSGGGAGGKPVARAPGATPAGTPAAAAALDSLPLAAGAPSTKVWPAGKPNPFDPAVPAPGSQLRPQGESGG